MQLFRGGILLVQRHASSISKNVPLNPLRSWISGLNSLERNSSVVAGIAADTVKCSLAGYRNIHFFSSFSIAGDQSSLACREKVGSQVEMRTSLKNVLSDSLDRASQPSLMSIRCVTTTADSAAEDSSASASNAVNRIKFKRLDKTAKHIMQIVDKEAVEEVKAQREIPDIRPGYIVQLKVEVPENKRRVQVLKGIVIARRNAGLNSTFRIRRLVAGVGVESLFPLYSPNIKEIKVLDKKKVRRAKLYYLRDKMNALKKQ